MLVVQRISNLGTKLGWFQLFFLAFRTKWKFELVAYCVIGLFLFILTFASIPTFGKLNTWVTMTLAVLTGGMSGPLLLRSSKFSAIILRKLSIQNHSHIPDKNFYNFYGIRITLVKLELIKCASLSKEKIEDLIKIFVAEASVPRYPYWAYRGFKAIFFLFLAGGIGFIFRINEKENFKGLWELFSIVSLLLVLIASIVYIFDVMILSNFFRFWVKKHYRVDMIRYLNEIKMMI